MRKLLLRRGTKGGIEPTRRILCLLAMCIASKQSGYGKYNIAFLGKSCAAAALPARLTFGLVVVQVDIKAYVRIYNQ